MTVRHSIAEARRDLPKLVRVAEAGETVEVTRRGAPVAVLVGRGRYERLTASRRGFAEAYRDFIESTDPADRAFDVDEVFEGVRHTTPGREVEL